jgi:hypothetical protein
MDKKSNLYETIVWEVSMGDLVKIKNYNFDGELSYRYGIVVSMKQECQIALFPFVDVYVFNTSDIGKYFPNSLEVVSSAVV